MNRFQLYASVVYLFDVVTVNAFFKGKESVLCQILTLLYAIPVSQCYGIDNVKVPKDVEIGVSVSKILYSYF